MLPKLRGQSLRFGFQRRGLLADRSNVELGIFRQFVDRFGLVNEFLFGRLNVGVT